MAFKHFERKRLVNSRIQISTPSISIGPPSGPVRQMNFGPRHYFGIVGKQAFLSAVEWRAVQLVGRSRLSYEGD